MFKISNSEFQNYGLTFLEKNDSIVSILYDRFIINEMYELQEAADKANIKIVFLKGIIEKYDVYKPLFLPREYSDIDILIERNDIYAFCNICKNLQYHPLEGEIDRAWIDSNIINDGRHHLPPIFKSMLNDKIMVCVEIHTVLDPAWNRKKNRELYIQTIINRKETYNCNGNLVLQGMDATDRIIFSFLHFCKDYLADFSTFYYCPEKQLFHAKTLMDAFLIVEKYYERINVEDLVNRIIFFDLFYQALFSCQMLMEIFELKFNNIFLKILQGLNERLSSHEISSFIDKILFSSYITILENGTKNKFLFYRNAINKCVSLNSTVEAKKHIATLIPMRCSTKKSQTSVFSKWSDTSFEIQVELNKAQINAYNTNHNYDGISIRVYNPEYTIEEDNAVRNLLVVFKETMDGTIIPDVTFNGRNPFERGIIVADNISVNCVCKGEKTNINIAIPWSLLKIKIGKTKYIGLDCHVRTYINQNEEIAYFSNAQEPFYNPAKFGRVTFC